MASAVYPKAKEQFLQGGINLSTANVKAVLVDGADYTYSAAHEFLTDVPSGARVATSGNLASKTFTNGVFDAADVTLAAVTGDPSEAVIVYVDTGTAGTSRLLAYVDQAQGGGAIAITPNGGDITVTWDNGANKIFAL